MLILITSFLIQFSHAQVELIKLKLKPGEVNKFSIQKPKEFIAEKGFCGTDEIGIFQTEDKMNFYFGFSYFTRPGLKFNCGFGADKIKKDFFEVEIIDGGFKEEILTVNKETVKLSKAALKRVAKDRKVLDQVYSGSPQISLFKDSFNLPMTSIVTSQYGGRRIYNDHKRSQHLGTDFRAKVGEEVKATNSGKVVLAKDLFFTGDTVIVDHGLGIFSVYAHLSKILVKDGEMVQKDQTLALSGASGRVSGPHLHWGIKMNKVWVDGLTLVGAK